MKKFYQIAIDGPAGSGKSTIAKLIAKNLSFTYIDSGAMYRAVTLFLIKKKLLNKSDREFFKSLKRIKINFLTRKNKELVFLNNKNVTNEIRKKKVSQLVSEVSSRKVVRKEMVRRQKEYGLKGSVVMDGRDIGTNVFPGANLKIYLTASSIIRAKRRKKDLEKLREKVRISELVKQIQDRDNYDSSRTISPLSKAQDAIVIDTGNLSIKEVLERIAYFLPNHITSSVKL